MNRYIAAVATSLLLSASAFAQGSSLPPDHPAVGNAPPLSAEQKNAPMPANHPPLQNAPPISPEAKDGPLPPNHPPVQGGAPPISAGAKDGPLPPNHPPVQGGAPPITDAQKNLPPPAGHPPMNTAADADALLKQIDAAGGLAGKEKTFEVASAVGKLYFKRGRYEDASKALAEAEKKGAEARTLFLAQRKKAGAGLPTPEAAGCPPGQSSSFETLLEAAKTKAKAGQSAQAAACARAALDPVIEVQDYRARASVLSNDAAGALKAYEGILEVDERNASALYGRAALLLDSKSDDVKALGEAKKGFERYLVAHPQGTHAKAASTSIAQADKLIAAGGATKYGQKREAEAKTAAANIPRAPMANAPFMQQQAQQAPAQGNGAAGPGPLSQEMVQAVQNTERTPELEQGLAKLVEEGEEHLARGRYQDALDAYKRVVPFQPENGRAKAGMAWALVGLNRQPMADNIWRVAVGADVSAVDKLGDTLKSKGDANGAKALWTKLAATSPDYASKLKSKLQ